MFHKMSIEKKVLTTLAVGAGGFLLYYLTSGAGSEKDAALIPDSVEKHLDDIVDALNAKLGKTWGKWGLPVLEVALSKALPIPVTALISVVHQAEQIGMQRKLSGAQKRMLAVQLAQAEKRA